MGKLRLTLFGESSYMFRLMNFIQKVGPGYLEMRRCTTIEAVLNSKPDIVLYEKYCEAETGLLPEGVLSILLTDMHQSSNGEVIFRYQQGQDILRQTFQIYREHGGQIPYQWCGNTHTKMTVFYAIGGHELDALFSMTYALIHGIREKVLYINLSSFSGMRVLLEESYKENFSDLVFGVRHNLEQFLIYLQSVLHHQKEIDYILPPENPCDLFEMEEGDILSLLNMLREQSDYDRVVWNCDCVNPVMWQLMENSSRIYCLCKESSMGKYRQEEMKHFIEKEACGQLQDKIQYISLQTTKNSLTKGVQVWEQLKQGELADQVRQFIQEENVDT